MLMGTEEKPAPACVHFADCGGCRFQDVPSAIYETRKWNEAAQLLAANGIEAALRPLITSEPASRRRAGFAATRTKKTLQFGYYARGTHTIISVTQCPLVDPEIEQAIPLLRGLVEGYLSRSARASIAVTATESGLDVSVSGGKPLQDAQSRMELVERGMRGDFARLIWNDELVAEYRAPLVDLSGLKIALPQGAFLQPTRQGEAALMALVKEAVGPARRVADLFSGCGTFTTLLARDAAVHAVEGEAKQLAALERAVHAQGPALGLKPVTTERRDLFKRPLLADELAKYEAVVIDPPRLGAAAQSAELARSHVGRVVMVSCNPATFARDAKLLMAGGYHPVWIAPIDQFLWSDHLELTALFQKD